eukprot:746676-Hanusia_phi.AAC.2
MSCSPADLRDVGWKSWASRGRRRDLDRLLQMDSSAEQRGIVRVCHLQLAGIALKHQAVDDYAELLVAVEEWIFCGASNRVGQSPSPCMRVTQLDGRWELLDLGR